ncbi:AP-5 complex subunit mu-1-like isoform X2 [Dermacentor andersoni]|uniref:AP-5 complex subunit mu-1-like isoform X2 n=1 Tax=Dermacentor andersoni TaxID=34620 RepID=UPI00241729BA|nr:AP-5 complex subunit mu-1-like isoform X2 [Dermacentor andersoni]
MSIRALCIISIPHKDAATTIYYKRFPTCELRAKCLEGYVPLPPHKGLAAALANCLDDTDLRSWREHVDQPLQLPALELSTTQGTLWPFVFVQKEGLYFGCLPLVSLPPGKRPDLLSLPGVTTALLAVEAVIEVLGSSIASLNAVPAWRPTAFHGKPVLRVQLREVVHSTQCERTDVSPTAQVSGSLRVHAELECRELSLSLASSGTLSPTLAAGVRLTTHRGAQGSTTWCIHMSPPPTHPVEALRYFLPPPVAVPPILGLYSMRGDKHIDFLLQLKLQAGIKNAFQSLDVRIPFFNRGRIKKSCLTPSCGSVSLARDKCSLLWTIGQKFPASSQEVSLTGAVHFEEQPADINASMLCTGLTSYVQVEFRMSNRTLSGCSLDAKSILVTPLVKFKLLVDHEVESSEYRIWNKFGEVPFATTAVAVD